MKALFNRFKKEKEREKFLVPSDVDPNIPSARDREKLDIPPLRQWPPPPQGPLDPSPNSFSSAKPLPPIDRTPISVSHTNSQASSESRSSTRTPVPPPSLARPPSRAPSTDERGGTVTRTEAPRYNSIDGASAAAASHKARKATAEASSPPDSAGHKKVAFLSPPPTPAPLERVVSNQSESGRANGADTSANDGGHAKAGGSGNTASNGDAMPKTPNGPLRTTVSRFQAVHGSETRGTGNASTSKVNVSKGVNGTAGKATNTATRTAISPNSQKNFADNMSLNASMRSNTPYSQASQSSSRILATASWSEAAEEDLVSNIGPRERTRQEVLWEIVASEERYVLELTKLKETFIEPLLHPYAAPPICSPTPLENDEYFARVESPRESIDHLPIAARFLSPTPGLRPETPAASKNGAHNADGDSPDSDDDEAQDQIGRGYTGSTSRVQQRNGIASSAVAAAIAKFNHPRSPYNTTAQRTPRGKAPLPFPSRSHQSLPPPPRVAQQGSSASLGRQSIYGTVPEREVSYAATGQTDKTDKTSASRVLKKLRRTTPQPDSLMGDSVPPNQLPEDLRKCLEVIETGIFNGHITLSEGLRKRYEEQYPLVRSLADVFVSNSHILREYATYVLHLERALEQVDNALSTASDKKKPKNQDSAMWVKVCKTLHRLEQDAVEKGETGLAISLSKPFQRLLKYPLLFQNLLYHTDPSTFEYESTLMMVAEVETIVRSIEDEKIQKEERDRTRDAFARIEGLEKVRQLALPKPSRLLVEERPLVTPSQTQSQPQSSPARPPPPSAANNASSRNVKGKSSFRRLSDVLQQSSQNAVGGKKDLWLVVFNDVVLRCQRTGITTLPLASSTNSRTNSLPDLQAKAKYASTGRKGAHTKPRNLYKFIKIENWAIAGVPDPKQGVIAMDDVVRSRATVHSAAPTGRSSVMPPEEEDDGADSSDSDRKSKMSFSYWGADKVTIHKPAVPKARSPIAGNRRGALTPLGYGRESSANAKFGNRLVHSPEPHMHHRDYHPHVRPASRRTQATPTSRRPGHSEDGHASAKSTVTSATASRPAWDGSTRSAGTTTPTSTRTRVRNISQTSGAKMPAAAANKLLASPAPSEDSGVGLYRKLMERDSQLNVGV
ncbi:Dbl domain-containing protein [Fomitiporia mediterranea MF3/22]|uniref:Dbl domain-containing protein n=1 Tax=Fomitiporia mediterranea (strain MF3/22) TaxID=694068 RepID=UPI0004408F69|nr:Dbl domain-containing protein [Fomitiporia mediterranea MF3/22]EJD05815.1 Dbl domain-containing protein [Fomitiporia mediterranea MF3/22]